MTSFFLYSNCFFSVIENGRDVIDRMRQCGLIYLVLMIENINILWMYFAKDVKDHRTELKFVFSLAITSSIKNVVNLVQDILILIILISWSQDVLVVHLQRNEKKDSIDKRKTKLVLCRLVPQAICKNCKLVCQ